MDLGIALPSSSGLACLILLVYDGLLHPWSAAGSPPADSSLEDLSRSGFNYLKIEVDLQQPEGFLADNLRSDARGYASNSIVVSTSNRRVTDNSGPLAQLTITALSSIDSVVGPTIVRLVTSVVLVTDTSPLDPSSSRWR